MIIFEPTEKTVLVARRHPFFLFLEILPLLALLIIPVLVVLVGISLNSERFISNTTNTITNSLVPSPPQSVLEKNPQAIDTVETERFVYFSGNFTALCVLFLSAWFLLMWIVYFVVWTDYYLDVLVLTNKKIIDIEQRGLFAREIITIPLEKIQDITVRIDGILATFFHFGTLQIQTASEIKTINIRYLAAPDKIKMAIIKEYDMASKTMQKAKGL